MLKFLALYITMITVH